jgi:hypothetical protein
MNTLSVIDLFPSDEREYQLFVSLLKKEINALPDKGQVFDQLKYIERVVVEIKDSCKE